MAEAPFIRVKNWTKFQHYKHRRPPWIKLHREFLDDFKFACLPLASRALAPCLWLIASESDDGSLPVSAQELAFRAHCSEEEILAAVNPLIDAGFLECSHDASALLASRKQNVTTETEKRQSRDRDRVTEAKAPASRAASPEGSADAGWNREAASDWMEAYDGEPLETYFGAVKKLVRKFGWARVRPVLRYYFTQTASEYVNLNKLRSAFGDWEKRSGGQARASPKAREHEAGLLAFIQGGKRDGRVLGQGDGVVGGESSAEGREPGRDGSPGRYLPPGTRTSDG